MVPGRVDLTPKDRDAGKRYIVVKTPPGADGQVWRTTTLTKGQVMFLNTPPLLSFHRNTQFAPREIAEAEGLGNR